MYYVAVLGGVAIGVVLTGMIVGAVARVTPKRPKGTWWDIELEKYVCEPCWMLLIETWRAKAEGGKDLCKRCDTPLVEPKPRGALDYLVEQEVPWDLEEDRRP